jgi:hypothetical protein
MELPGSEECKDRLSIKNLTSPQNTDRSHR